MDLLNVVSEEESQQIENLLNKAFENAPSFHTDTEIRVGVLDGSKFPTPASKYYRSLSEINKIQVGLKTLIFEYRLQEQELKLLKINNLVGTNDETKIEVSKIEIKIESIEFTLKNLKREIEGRLKELLLWDKVITDLEPVLVQQDLPLNNPDAYQKVYLLIKGIKQCREKLATKGIKKEEIRNIFISLLSNAEIIKQKNLTSAVLKELTLSEKEFVNTQKILPVTFTEDEIKLIQEANEFKKEVAEDSDVAKELEDMKTKLDDLMSKQKLGD